METNNNYSVPESELQTEITPPKAGKFSKIYAIVITIISVAMLTPVGSSHAVDGFYTFGFAISGIIFAGFFLGITQILKFFRRPTPRLVTYSVLLTLHTLLAFPQLLFVLNT